jgi:two-component system, LytTR family, sensor histidine kinase AgrC
LSEYDRLEGRYKFGKNELYGGAEMNLLLFIFDHSNQLIEAFIWYRLMTNMLECKYSKKVYMLAASMIFWLLLLKGFIFKLPVMENLRGYGSFVIILYTLVAAILLFKNPFFEKLIWWGVFYIGLIIMELVTITFMSTVLRISLETLQNDEVINNTATVATKVVTLILFELLIRRRRAKLQIKESVHKNLSILVISNVVLIIGSVIAFFNMNNIDLDLDTVIQFFLGIVLLIEVITFLLVFKMDRDSRKELQTQLKLQQIQLELKQNNDMINITENLRKLRHDMNNHIGLIKSMVDGQKYDYLKTYVDELYGDVAIANDFIVAENTALSVILNAKREKARELNIDFQSLIAAKNIAMQDKDICVLFGNILDNAIEAAEKSMNKKYIDFSIQRTDSGCIIQCENSLGIRPIERKGRFISSKENKYLHGIGIENIKDIVAKYKGELNFDYDDEVFNLRIVLPV